MATRSGRCCPRHARSQAHIIVFVDVQTGSRCNNVTSEILYNIKSARKWRASYRIRHCLVCHLCSKWQVEWQLCSKTVRNFNSVIIGSAARVWLLHSRRWWPTRSLISSFFLPSQFVLFSLTLPEGFWATMNNVKHSANFNDRNHKGVFLFVSLIIIIVPPALSFNLDKYYRSTKDNN